MQYDINVMVIIIYHYGLGHMTKSKIKIYRRPRFTNTMLQKQYIRHVSFKTVSNSTYAMVDAV